MALKKSIGTLSFTSDQAKWILKQNEGNNKNLISSFYLLM